MNLSILFNIFFELKLCFFDHELVRVHRLILLTRLILGVPRYLAPHSRVAVVEVSLT